MKYVVDVCYRIDPVLFGAYVTFECVSDLVIYFTFNKNDVIFIIKSITNNNEATLHHDLASYYHMNEYTNKNQQYIIG